MFHTLVGDHIAIAQHNHPISVAGNPGIMGHKYGRDAFFPVQRLENLHHFFTAAGIQVAGWLVGQDDRGFVDQRPRDGDTLLLPAGKFTGQVIQTFAQTDRFQGCPCLLGTATRTRIHAGAVRPVAGR